MPDPLRKSVSASQMSALFGFSGHGLSKWMVWHWFKGDAELPLDDPNERMNWGNALQEPILQRTAFDYRAKKLLSNTKAMLYVRRGRIGHTRDGRLLGSGRGRINVEAKNVDYMVWKRDWSETSAPQEIEIQAEVGTYVDRCDMTIIAALIGGNTIKYYERAPRVEFHDRLRDTALKFFDDLKHNREPDPLGIQAEVPMLAQLYPQTDPAKVLERLEDAELREMLLQFKHGRDQETFGRRLVELGRPKILAIAQDCSIVRANGIEAAIRKFERPAEEQVNQDVLFAAQAVRVWARVNYTENVAAWPKELRALSKVLASPWVETRKASIAQHIDTFLRYGDPALPGDDVVEELREREISP